MKGMLVVMLVATWFVSPVIAGHLADGGHWLFGLLVFAAWAYPIGRLLR